MSSLSHISAACARSRLMLLFDWHNKNNNQSSSAASLAAAQYKFNVSEASAAKSAAKGLFVYISHCWMHGDWCLKCPYRRYARGLCAYTHCVLSKSERVRERAGGRTASVCVCIYYSQLTPSLNNIMQMRFNTSSRLLSPHKARPR
jgi:hypothetical protein